MTDPVSGVLLSVFLKKIADLLGEPLAKALQGRRSRGRKRQLLDLYTRLKAMESSVDDLMALVDELSTGSGAVPLSFDVDRAIPILQKLQSNLTEIGGDLARLAPGFEIMAEDAAALIAQFAYVDQLVLDRWGLLRRGDESFDTYQARLVSVRARAVEARAALVSFLQRSYTWETI